MNTPGGRRERGAVLIVALIFLVILTMLGVTAMTGTTMELRMAGNTRDLAVALHAAEAAVRDAENDIQGKTYLGKGGLIRAPFPLAADYGNAGVAGTCNSASFAKGLCRPISTPVDNQPLPQDIVTARSINMTSTSTATYGEFTGATAIQGVANQPRYVVELLQGLSPRAGVSSIGGGTGARIAYYRITARGYGSNPNSVVTVSEVFSKPESR